MILKFTNFDDGVHYLNFDKDAGLLNLDKEIFNGNVHLEVKMDKSVHQIVIDADLEAEVNFICDRCGEEYQTVLNNSFKMIYSFGRDSENDDLNFKVISPETDRINLDRETAEYALLAIPMKKLCSEDCKGLCVVCGSNLNKVQCNCNEEKTNPIWEDLLKLKK